MMGGVEWVVQGGGGEVWTWWGGWVWVYMCVHINEGSIACM